MANQPAEPINVVDLFPPMRAELLSILARLNTNQWGAPTVCIGWSVKDVALHLLADDISILSGQRDGFAQGREFEDWEDLVGWINMRNDIWVRAMRRISTPLLLTLLESTGQMVYDYFAALNPYEPSNITVDWAGDDPAPVWLEIAREYTEFWMHHQHICDAMGITSLKERKFFHPALDIFMRGLPNAYRKTVADNGTVISLVITGAVGDDWYLLREDETWRLYAEVDKAAACTITMPPEAAWRLLTKGLTPGEVRHMTTIEGEPLLAEPFLHMVSIIA